MLRTIRYFLAIATVGLMASVAQGQSAAALGNKAMFAINGSSGNLVHYNGSTGQLTTLGPVVNEAGTLMTGIKAAAYFPGFQNMFALWACPSDSKQKLVYINVSTGAATTVASDVEGGNFTGACTAATASSPYGLFTVQAAKVKPPSTITGTVNINPNNNASNEFTLTKGDGSKITRDNLQGATVDANGTYYQGSATFFHLKPKGNGNQNGLIIDGVAYALQNANTYDFSGNMQVRVYNDKVSGNLTAMGHWWLQVFSGTVIINNAVQVLTPSRISQVDQKTGTVTEIMVVSKTYNGLATTDGKIFYTSSDSDLYKINTSTQSETKVGEMSLDTPGGMAFVDGSLLVIDTATGYVSQIDPATGKTVGSPTNSGTVNSGPVGYTPLTQDPSLTTGMCD